MSLLVLGSAIPHPQQFIQCLKDDNFHKFNKFLRNPDTKLVFDQPLDNSGRSAVLIAAEHPRLGIFRYILKNIQFDVNHTNYQNGNSVIAELIRLKKYAAAKEYLLKNPNINQINQITEKNALIITIEELDLDAFNLLIKHDKCDVNTIYPDRSTVLHKTIQMSPLLDDFFEILIQHPHIDFSIQDASGHTPYSLALSLGKVKLSQQLLSVGGALLGANKTLSIQSEQNTYIPFVTLNGKIVKISEFTQLYQDLKLTIPNFSNAGARITIPEDPKDKTLLLAHLNLLVKRLVANISLLQWSEIITISANSNPDFWVCLHYLYYSSWNISSDSLAYRTTVKNLVENSLSTQDLNQYKIFQELILDIAQLRARVQGKTLPSKLSITQFAENAFACKIHQSTLAHYSSTLQTTIDLTFTRLLNSINDGLGAVTKVNSQFTLATQVFVYMPFIVAQTGALVKTSRSNEQVIQAQTKLPNLFINSEEFTSLGSPQSSNKSINAQIVLLSNTLREHLTLLPLNKFTKPLVETKKAIDVRRRNEQFICIHYLYFLNASVEIPELKIELSARDFFEYGISNNRLKDFNDTFVDIIKTKLQLLNLPFNDLMEFDEFTKLFYGLEIDDDVLEKTYNKLLTIVKDDYLQPIEDEVAIIRGKSEITSLDLAWLLKFNRIDDFLSVLEKTKISATQMISGFDCSIATLVINMKDTALTKAVIEHYNRIGLPEDTAAFSNAV